MKTEPKPPENLCVCSYCGYTASKSIYKHTCWLKYKHVTFIIAIGVAPFLFAAFVMFLRGV